MISLVTRILDVLLVGVGGVIAYGARFGLENLPPSTSYSALLLIGGLLVAIVFPLVGVYDSWRARGLWAPAVRVVGAWALVLVSLFALLILMKLGTTYSRLWLGFWAVIGAALLSLLRLVVYYVLRIMRKRGYNRRRAVVVGCGPLARDLIRRAREETWAGFEVSAVFDAGGNDRALPDEPLRPLDTLFDYVSGHDIDEVWIAVPLEQTRRLRDVLESLRFSTANVRFVPDLFGLFLINHGVSQILDMPMFDLTASPMTGVNRLVKGLEDRLLSLMILIVISPLLLVLAIGVKLSSPGPVFFRQQRLGWDGKTFEIYKFRSMRQHDEPEGQIVQATRDDPRLTRLGAWMRRTSLDELPQFINVLQGRMSIVGPRPHAIAHNEAYKDQVAGYMLRHKVKPGITGWAQVNGWRGETDTLEKMQRRVEHDLYYIEHWSLAFDLKIIFLTLLKGFVNKNAY
ncbi:undecaprenyl-phosphate glucose phosphotransferase [Halothiobacillus diazotrophicus]|uniref:Undecaprenyl-phosphate glucose phosphotransferase n=1 Tax=Halothiobacillus diazotrophicus TaxID=1860122 RepID=A0A191ZKL7_9GAMM|nr:undecaprenyl-phosphate glucose phosphotransferase [Halothiobacillus diazotrophicus]